MLHLGTAQQRLRTVRQNLSPCVAAMSSSQKFYFLFFSFKIVPNASEHTHNSLLFRVTEVREYSLYIHDIEKNLYISSEGKTQDEKGKIS